MKKLTIVICLFFLIFSGCNKPSELKKYETLIGGNYPDIVKSYLSKLDGNKLSYFYALHDSFQIINTNNLTVLDDRVLSKENLIIELEDDVRKEYHDGSIKTLPIARSMTGDKFGILFFICNNETVNSTILYHRDTDRPDWKAIPIGDFFDYVSDLSIQKNELLCNISKERTIPFYIKSKKEILDAHFYFCKPREIKQITESNSNIETKIFFKKYKETKTEILINHTLNYKNKTYLFESSYIDENPKHQYSYLRNLYYHYFPIIQYCTIDSFERLKYCLNISDKDFEILVANYSLRENIRKNIIKD